MHRLIDSKEHLRQYSTFRETVMRIGRLVRQRTETDFYGWVDFRTENYEITRKYYLRRKVLFQNNKRLERSLHRHHPHDGVVAAYI